MGYYIRVLGTQDPDIHLDELLEGLRADGLTAKLAFAESEQASKWTILQIANEQGATLTQVERNQVCDGELGKEEMKDCKPTLAVQWLTSYFDKVKVIYAFQILNEAFADNNFEIISSIKTKIWN